MQDGYPLNISPPITQEPPKKKRAVGRPKKTAMKNSAQAFLEMGMEKGKVTVLVKYEELTDPKWEQLSHLESNMEPAIYESLMQQHMNSK